MRELRLGLFDSTAVVDADDPLVTAQGYEHHIADAQLAERLGYDYFFFIEHQNAGFPCISAPTAYLTALARATSRMRIGVMIFQLPLHQPIRLAQDAALIDHLSHGRLEFGIGYGTRAREFEPWHVAFTERRELGQEVLEIVLRAWTEREFSYAGKYWHFDGAKPQPRPYQRPHPPIWVGAHSKPSYEYAAERNYNVAQIFEVERTTTEKFEHYRAHWHKQGRAGQPPLTALVRHVHVAETDEAAHDEADRYILNGIQGPAGVERALSLRPEESTPDTLELARVYLETSRSVQFWLDEGLAFVGSPETVAAAIQAQRERVGYDVLLLNHKFHDLPRGLYLKSLQLFGERVIPALRGALSARP